MHLQKRILADGQAVMYLGDCLNIIPTLQGSFGAVITDPPYGVAYQHGESRADRSGAASRASVKTKPCHGDDSPFDAAHLFALEGPLRRNSAGGDIPMVMFGANHYSHNIPQRGQWLVWDKSCGKGPASAIVDAEFAWMNRRNGRCIYRHLWLGLVRTPDIGNPRRVHPMQKPVGLLSWVMETARVGLDVTVFDPYAGSGTTGVACLRTGRRFIGIEIDPEYFEISCKRIQDEYERMRDV